MADFKQRIFDMSLQDAFSTAYLGLASQNFQQSLNPEVDYSKNPDMACLYRGPNGLKCGVGHLIQDDEYLPAMEGIGVSSKYLLGTEYYHEGSHQRKMIDMLADIQKIHDDIVAVELMSVRLKDFAFAYNLKVPEIPDAASV